MELWAQQPEGALETAAELDSTELARMGNLQSLVEHVRLTTGFHPNELTELPSE